MSSNSHGNPRRIPAPEETALEMLTSVGIDVSGINTQHLRNTRLLLSQMHGTQPSHLHTLSLDQLLDTAHKRQRLLMGNSGTRTYSYEQHTPGSAVGHGPAQSRTQEAAQNTARGEGSTSDPALTSTPDSVSGNTAAQSDDEVTSDYDDIRSESTQVVKNDFRSAYSAPGLLDLIPNVPRRLYYERDGSIRTAEDARDRAQRFFTGLFMGTFIRDENGWVRPVSSESESKEQEAEEAAKKAEEDTRQAELVKQKAAADMAAQAELVRQEAAERAARHAAKEREDAETVRKAEEAAREAAIQRDKEVKARQAEEAAREAAQAKHAAIHHWMTESSAWCSIEELNSAFFKKGAVHSRIPSSDASAYWTEFYNAIKSCDRSPFDPPLLSDPETDINVGRLGFTNRTWIMACSELLNNLIPGRKNTGDRNLVHVTIPPRCDEYTAFRNAFDWDEGCIDGSVSRERYDNYLQMLHCGVRVLGLGKSADQGGPRTEFLTTVLKTTVNKCVEREVLYLYKDADTSEIYLLNIFAFNEHCSDDLLEIRKTALRRLILAMIACISNAAIKSVPMNLDPLLFTCMFYDFRGLTTEDIVKFLIPRHDSDSFKVIAMILFAEMMSSTSSGDETFQYEDLVLSDSKVGGIPYFFKSPVGHDVEINLGRILSCDAPKDSKFLNPYFLKAYFEKISQEMFTIFQFIVSIMHPVFHESNISHERITRYLTYNRYDQNALTFNGIPIDLTGYSTRGERDSFPSFDGFKTHSAIFINSIKTHKVHRDGVMFQVTDEACENREIFALHETRAEALKCLFYALASNKEDPPRLLSGFKEKFMEPPEYAWDQGWDTEEEHRNLISEFIPAHEIHIDPESHFIVTPSWTLLNSEHRQELDENVQYLNRLLKYARKHSLPGASEEACEGYDTSRLNDIPFRVLPNTHESYRHFLNLQRITSRPRPGAEVAAEPDPVQVIAVHEDEMNSIFSFIDKTRDLVLTAKTHLLAAYTADSKKFYSMDEAALEDLMKNGEILEQEDGSISRTGPTMQPVIRDLELCCPVAENGVICDYCSSKWCSKCFCEAKPCSFCEHKFFQLNAATFINEVTANKPCNTDHPVHITLQNGLMRHQLEGGRFQPLTNDAPLRLCTCALTITLNPDDIKMHELPPSIFGHIRHSLVAMLMTARGGFDSS